MTSVHKHFSDYAVSPDQVTFSVLDQDYGGHSVYIASGEYAAAVRATKNGFSDLSAATVFHGAIEILRRNVGCADIDSQREDDSLLYAFIAAMLKHPHKPTRKKLMAGISHNLKKNGCAHLILLMPPTGPSFWMVADQKNNG